MVADKVAGMVADMGADKKKLADMEFDMVTDKEVAKLSDMVAGHGRGLVNWAQTFFDLNLIRYACLLSFASLFK